MEHWYGDTDRGKLKYWGMKNLCQCHFAINLTWTDQGSKPSLRGERDTHSAGVKFRYMILMHSYVTVNTDCLF